MATLLYLRLPHYGYALLQKMQAGGISIEANTLYPLLRRLEEQGLLTSSWDVTESRPRKYYVISNKGELVLGVLMTEWDKLKESLGSIESE